MTDHIWVRTAPVPGGGYELTVEFDADTAAILSRVEAHDYVDELYAALHRAEYDAAIFGQLSSKLGMNVKAVAHTLEEVRARREPLTWSTALTLNPGVSAEGKAFLHIVINGEPAGQWSPDDARHHAQGVLDGLAVAALDDVYRDTLIQDVGVEPELADAVVAQLVEFRPGDDGRPAGRRTPPRNQRKGKRGGHR